MSLFKKLTEGTTQPTIAREGEAVLKKWEKTGLLEGLAKEHDKKNMAVLLENQARELLREATAMSDGDVEGFAAVAFPLVRRVFSGLIANELVSVQPMSLPSGLIFFLDFTYTDNKYSAGAGAGESIYGGGVVANQLTGGVNLTSVNETQDLWNVEKGPYSLNNAYSSPTSSAAVTLTCVAARSGSGSWPTAIGTAAYYNLGDALISHDPDLSGSVIAVYTAPKASFTNLNTNNLIAIHTDATGTMSPYTMVRRLTKLSPLDSSKLLLVFATYASGSEDTSTSADTADDMNGSSKTFTYAAADSFSAGSSVGSVVGAAPWGLEGTNTLTNSGTNTDIPEIDIKINSIPVTAKSRKLKAKWSPEVGQDMSAYHNIDPEVELTRVLSEHITLDIDQEILADLRNGATAGTFFWSRKPGKFVNRTTGKDITSNGATLPDFTGNVSMWYETLAETINDVSAQIHRKILRGGANFIVTSPEVANILEFTSGFRANMTGDEVHAEIGALKVGSLSKKWDVYVDPRFPRNVVLVGRKGGSFLESGYVYAPYVPLQVSPTIFGVEDMVPRKMIMTRYSKAMARPDFYGLVIIEDLLFG